MKIQTDVFANALAKTSLFLSIFLLLFFLSGKTIIASDNFNTSYNVTYDVNNDEITKVTLNIGLTNKTTDYYAASYGVQTGFDNISNIYVADSTGPLEFTTEKNDSGTQISFDFNDKTVGQGNTQKASISFDTKEIAKNHGTVWEVNIPGISNQEDFKSFNVEVRTPESFGKASIIKPNAANVKSNNESIFFNKSDLGKGGIAIAYGDHQTYQFNLKYHITNKNVFPELTEIALPSDTSYQKVAIDTINPKPENVIIDQDGNWLARFKLLPSQDLTITVVGKAKVSYLPRSEELTDQQRNLYLKPQKYWEANDKEIKEIASSLNTPESIYQYVVDNLSYDTGRIQENQVRVGAKNVVKDPESAVCLEFTDLFVALARSSGIPARAIEGYANTSNSADRPLSLVEDVLHAWPEYYDSNKKAWVSVDPTWGNTTKGIDYFNVFDFDHLAFVTKGVESDYPIPAGGYKLEPEKNEKDVHVATLDKFQTDLPSLTLTTDFPKNFYGGFPISGNIIVTNNSNVISSPQSFVVNVDGINPSSQELFVDEIPPYGHKVLKVNFEPVNILTNSEYVVKISLKQDNLEKVITILPFYRSIYFAYFLGGILSGILVLFISFVIYRTRRLHFPK